MSSNMKKYIGLDNAGLALTHNRRRRLNRLGRCLEASSRLFV